MAAKKSYKRKPADKRVTHGVVTFLHSKKLNPSIRGYKKLQEHLLTMENSLSLEQCDAGMLTAREEILIKGTVEAYGIVLLGGMFVKKYGILSPSKAKKGELEYQHILAKSMIAYQNTIRQNILALESIRRENGRKKPVMSETEFVREIEEGSDEEVQDDQKTEGGALSE